MYYQLTNWICLARDHKEIEKTIIMFMIRNFWAIVVGLHISRRKRVAAEIHPMNFLFSFPMISRRSRDQAKWRDRESADANERKHERGQWGTTLRDSEKLVSSWGELITEALWTTSEFTRSGLHREKIKGGCRSPAYAMKSHFRAMVKLPNWACSVDW